MNSKAVLEGVKVVSLAVNVPGPVAASRLREMGASVTKIEPPSGDFLASVAGEWYDELCRGVEVKTLNLKSSEGRDALGALLATSDVLIVSSRPSALARLGVARDAMNAAFPTLCVVSIVGHATPDAELAGHDLTYQSDAGLIDDVMPTTLIADMAAAEESVSAALALLVQRARTGRGGWTEISLREAAARMALPRLHKLTVRSGVLGGALPQYGLYRTAEGLIAVAALEPHFAERLRVMLQLPVLTHDGLARAFAAKTAAEWAQWGAQHGVPVAEVMRR